MNKTSLINGSVFRALVAFSFPLIVTNTVSILFHAADVAVLAFFSEGPAVAAVGACGSLITLLVSIFTGLSAGANVLISKCIGAGDEKRTKDAVGTSLTVGVISGVFLMVVARSAVSDSVACGLFSSGRSSPHFPCYTAALPSAHFWQSLSICSFTEAFLKPSPKTTPISFGTVENSGKYDKNALIGSPEKVKIWRKIKWIRLALRDMLCYNSLVII